MANVFDSDPRIIDYWRFENNLTAGKNGNNLTASAGGVGYESGSPLEGSYSLDLENTSNQWAFRNDTDLSSGFPLKSDDATKKLSWAFWCKPESTPTSAVMVAKYRGLSGYRSLMVGIYSGDLYLTWGYAAGTNYDDWNVGAKLTAGTVYHVGIAVDGIAKTALIRIWNGVSATSYTKTNWSGQLHVCNEPFVVGNNGSFLTTADFDGLIDELVVANELFTAGEFDEIREGTYNISASPSLSPSVSHSVSPSPSLSPSPSASPSASPSVAGSSTSPSISLSISPGAGAIGTLTFLVF